MNFYKLRPEVAGNIFGQGSVVDVSVHPPKVKQLDYQFDGWLGDDLLKSSACYIVTERLKNALLAISPTGVKFDTMTVSKSEQFEDIYPNRQLPTFFWLKINGQAGVDDFGIFENFKLVVSEKVLKLMKSFQLNNCETEEFISETVQA